MGRRGRYDCKGGAEEALSGDGTILYLGRGGGYTNVHVRLNYAELYTHTNERV